MPCVPRLDPPGTLHHVMIWGIEKGNIVTFAGNDFYAVRDRTRKAWLVDEKRKGLV